MLELKKLMRINNEEIPL